MDVLAHTLWTNAVFYSKYPHRRHQRYWAAFFGVVPDLISFVPVFAYWFVSGNGWLSKNDLLVGSSNWGVEYAAHSYNYTHSLVVFAAVFLVVMLFRKGKPYWPLAGWALHIGIDIFTHKGFYETPFLFPLSNARNHFATPWSAPLFMMVNYGSLLIVYAIIFWTRSGRVRQFFSRYVKRS